MSRLSDLQLPDDPSNLEHGVQAGVHILMRPLHGVVLLSEQQVHVVRLVAEDGGLCAPSPRRSLRFTTSSSALALIQWTVMSSSSAGLSPELPVLLEVQRLVNDHDVRGATREVLG